MRGKIPARQRAPGASLACAETAGHRGQQPQQRSYRDNDAEKGRNAQVTNEGRKQVTTATSKQNKQQRKTTKQTNKQNKQQAALALRHLHCQTVANKRLDIWDGGTKWGQDRRNTWEGQNNLQADFIVAVHVLAKVLVVGQILIRQVVLNLQSHRTRSMHQQHCKRNKESLCVSKMTSPHAKDKGHPFPNSTPAPAFISSQTSPLRPPNCHRSHSNVETTITYCWVGLASTVAWRT